MFNAVITDVQGRPTFSWDAAFVQAQENLLAGGAMLSSIVSNLAQSPGEPQIIDNVYQDVLGIQPSAAQVSAEQASLGAGGTIANCESNLSQSAQGQAVIDQAFNDFGQLAPTGSSMQSAEEALAKLAQAVNATNGLSAADLASLSQEYTAASPTFSLSGLVATLASSPSEATGLVASALVNSYVDDAPAQADVSTLLNAGGESLEDAAFDQAEGLASAASVSLSGVTGCSNTMQFIATCVTQISNSTIATINQNANYNIGLDQRFTKGVIWSTQVPPGTSLYNRIQQQGYPYENYVTSTLGSGFIQTSKPYPVSDQWNSNLGIAVGDKTIDTQGLSYGNNPNMITTMMNNWAEEMIGFVSSNRYTPSITQGLIKSFGFDLGVPVQTTGPEWTAICAGRQDMLNDFAAPGSACNIVIHCIS